MTAPVLYEIRDGIALITLNAPPVNGLGQALRAGIQETFARASTDDSVRAVVIASSSPIFCGGADIVEFGSGNFGAEPNLPGVLRAIELSHKPVVAAINGMALGGGLELALVCDYRIADAKARVGLPEVSLGIIPGAGGTQRLPRLINVDLALDMIVSGVPVAAAQAQEAGLIDRVHGDAATLLDAAIAYANELVDSKAPLRDCAQMPAKTGALGDSFFADYRQAIARRSRGFYAPERCIQAVEIACNQPLEVGLQREAELFVECMNTPQARAQQHLFFAERAAGKVPGVDPKTPPRKVEKVAIIGSGTMGGGIAMNFINAGIPTLMLDLNGEALERGIGVIRTNYEISAKKGKLTAEQVEQRMALLQPTTSYDDLRDVDLVIEAVFEKMEVKHAVFKTLDEVCKPGAILASNTSTLDVNEIAAVTRRPQDVIGLHFFSPANVMRLLEVVRADKTADDVIVTVLKLGQRIKKLPVVVGVCFGFVGNRMLEPYGREATRLVLEGAAPEQIDRVLTEFGLAMGLCSMSDLAGIDISYLTRQAHRAAIAHDPSYAVVCDRLYEQGDCGQKTGRGFYIYNGREKSPNPDVLTIARAEAARLGVEQREISDQEILERCLYPLINEGALILEEGIAARSSDCDLIYVNGYGFPAWRGGPMQYADEIGLQTVVDGINKYRQQLGEYGEMWFRPAPLLQQLAAGGKSFRAFRKV
ncbi:3-hydroxyacyl-CoA dehydrogenase NAD-binding domain-containing protein [Pseudomaricurvus sp. HS19]|uniref:3-hydroxyacyl-CoA dehydrogenase NAD-binding domain-containing protein n=1 Tax=Pseudomaricurvus sp. HS19 TaxID=2692626 RepID=UPI001367C871|nr:3-hydroxyacyl-CoA dehydrogenase NAD-binding domain-containing protein [Pseudomaricurvus sp. HS19]MYM64413.1 3-hydroxyacyl-CoA dehydrogenase [Pseudomaricurvus sp. HS19]